MADPRTIPGYRGQEGPPDDFVPSDTRLWSANDCDNARFGARLRGAEQWPCGDPFPCLPDPEWRGPSFYPGFADLVSLHPMRAMHLAGSSTTIPGQEYVYGFTPEYGPIDEEHSQQHTWDGVEPADDMVPLEFVAQGDFGSLGEYLTVTGGGLVFGDVFRTTGQDSPMPSFGTLQVSASDWNAAIEPNGNLTIVVTATRYVAPVSGSWVRWRACYTGADTVTHEFVNNEVCFHHAGYGYAVDGNGFTVPTTLHQPDRSEPVMASVGAFWTVKSGEPFDLGGPGFAVAVLPVQLPPALELLFGSYPVVCGVEA